MRQPACRYARVRNHHSSLSAESPLTDDHPSTLPFRRFRGDVVLPLMVAVRAAEGGFYAPSCSKPADGVAQFGLDGVGTLSPNSASAMSPSSISPGGASLM